MERETRLLVRKIAEDFFNAITKEIGILNIFPVDIDRLIH